MNKNILAAFGVGALLAGGGAFLVMSNHKPAPLEITSRTTEQALKAEQPAAPPAPLPVIEEPPPAVQRAPKASTPKRPTQPLAALITMRPALLDSAQREFLANYRIQT